MSGSSREFKDAVYGQLARIGKAASSPRRVELLDLLTQGPRTVEVLAGITGMSMANTSHHLKVLREACLVEGRKNGLYVTCQIAGADVERFLWSLKSLGESRLAEIEKVSREFHEGRKDMEPVRSEALLQRVRAGLVIVLDVRPAEEYHAGHIPGAVSVPFDEMKQRLAEIPQDREIVAYCRGPYCVLALDAAKMLRGLGRDAVAMDQGVLEWRARGWDVSA